MISLKKKSFTYFKKNNFCIQQKRKGCNSKKEASKDFRSILKNYW